MTQKQCATCGTHCYSNSTTVDDGLCFTCRNLIQRGLPLYLTGGSTAIAFVEECLARSDDDKIMALNRVVLELRNDLNAAGCEADNRSDIADIKFDDIEERLSKLENGRRLG